LTERHVGDSYFLAVHDGNLRGADALRQDAANGSITLVTIFPPDSP
jgi:hypothetical protein